MAKKKEEAFEWMPGMHAYAMRSDKIVHYVLRFRMKVASYENAFNFAWLCEEADSMELHRCWAIREKELFKSKEDIVNHLIK